jgi:hypothetical protein
MDSTIARIEGICLEENIDVKKWLRSVKSSTYMQDMKNMLVRFKDIEFDVGNILWLNI